MKRITWFTVSGRDQFLVGVPLQIAGTTTGYDLALDHARGAIQRPHDTVDRDLLTAECNDLAETMIQIAKEDGDALSLGAVFRAMMLEAARAEAAS